ncbi:hypothetical protein B23_0649 [Geobacillus thermoleovorans B23]|nr:hypothetical protein B23_0649 [Geobacillus thermoleovorans B23]
MALRNLSVFWQDKLRIFLIDLTSSAGKFPAIPL